MYDKKWGVPLLLVIAVLLISNVRLWNQNNDLERDLINLERDYQNQVSMLRSEINQIYVNVDRQLEEQASLVTELNYTFGALNPKNHTAALQIELVPKNVSDDMQLELSFLEETVSFTRNGDRFSATLPIGLFVDYDEHPLLSIHYAGQTQTQLLDQVSLGYLFTSYLPSLSASLSGSLSLHTDVLTMNQTLYVDFFASAQDKLAFAAGESVTPPDDSQIATGTAAEGSWAVGAAEVPVTFESFVLFVLLNGEEISREDLTADIVNSDTYQDCYYQTSFERKYNAKEGDKLEIYVEATDTLGYTHRCLAESWYHSNGATAEAVYAGEHIYDEQGNLLYGKS